MLTCHLFTDLYFPAILQPNAPRILDGITMRPIDPGVSKCHIAVKIDAISGIRPSLKFAALSDAKRKTMRRGKQVSLCWKTYNQRSLFM